MIRRTLNIALFMIYTIILIFATYFVTRVFTPNYTKDYYDLSNKNQELTATLDKYRRQPGNSENVNISNVKSSDVNKSFSNIFFEDGNIYKIENFTFYSDMGCNEEITESLTFSSYVDVNVGLSSGSSVYLSKSRERGYVWSKERPYFNIVN